MNIKSAIRKIYTRQSSKYKYNSDYILSHKEKEHIIIAVFIVIFILIIPTLVMFLNNG